ncbi:MAG: hypothetical protein K5761_08280 [Clostridiales bacterium]|nr:hypothetical protein [Clostridiales bacterium]
MLKKVLLPLFITICFAVCLVPSVGKIFNPKDEAIGNEIRPEFPSFEDKDGSSNLDYLNDLGSYFDTHFAFRPEIITADAAIQSKLFGTSNAPKVVCGKDGWLYYSSTVDDYTGRNQLTEEEIQGLLNNLRIIQDYANSNGAEFLFTIAPNKNTLYPEHMPYYYTKSGSVYNRDTVSKALKDSDINYFDLFELLEGQNEILYFARDSHWNNKGALLAYNGILDSLEKSHDDFSDAAVIRKKDFNGDLAKMVFPAGAEPEYNYYYGAEEKFKYLTQTESVEDFLIQTSCESANGKLYMYRDSFGNALLPFFASAYREATFTKAFPINLDMNYKDTRADTFIIEIAERNIGWFIENPPIMLSPRVTVFKTETNLNEKIDAEISEFEDYPAFVYVRGKVPEEYKDAESVFVSLKGIDGEDITRECYTVFTDGQREYLAYFDKNELDISTSAEISVKIKDGDKRICLGSGTINIGGIQ